MIFSWTYWPVYLRFSTYSFEPLRAIVPKLSINYCLDMPIPLSSIMIWFFSGKVSILMKSPSEDWPLNLCFSKASEALERSYRMNTSLSVYRDFATMSRIFLVYVLNYIFWAPGLDALEKKNEHSLLLLSKGRAWVFLTFLNMGMNPQILLDNILFLIFWYYKVKDHNFNN
jgi:hypothetical protein